MTMSRQEKTVAAFAWNVRAGIVHPPSRAAIEGPCAARNCNTTVSFAL